MRITVPIMLLEQDGGQDDEQTKTPEREMKNGLFHQWPPFKGWQSAPAAKRHFVSPYAEFKDNGSGSGRKRASGPMGWEDQPQVTRRRPAGRPAWHPKA